MQLRARRPSRLVAFAFLLAWQVWPIAAQDLNYNDDYELYQKGYQYDNYDEKSGGMYFNAYTGVYDDVDGDYFFDDHEEKYSPCRIGKDGKVSFNKTKRPCDLKLEGADKHVDLLPGGLDGLYKVWSCEGGRALYKRDKSPPGEDRILWYSAKFKDWDVNNGTQPVVDDILLYGGDGTAEGRPDFVKKDGWHVAADFQTGYNGIEDYLKIELTVKCANKKEEVKPPKPSTLGQKPLLTDEEMVAQYRQVINRQLAKNPPPSRWPTVILILMFIAGGVGILFGLPYLVASHQRAKRMGKGGGWINLMALRKGDHDS